MNKNKLILLTVGILVSAHLYGMEAAVQLSTPEQKTTIAAEPAVPEIVRLLNTVKKAADDYIKNHTNLDIFWDLISKSPCRESIVEQLLKHAPEIMARYSDEDQQDRARRIYSMLISTEKLLNTYARGSSNEVLWDGP